MRVPLRHFLIMTSLFLTLLAAACSGGVEPAVHAYPGATSFPVFTLVPTLTTVPVATPARPEVTQAVVAIASPMPEPTAVPAPRPRPVPTPAINRAPAPPPATPQSVPVSSQTRAQETTPVPTSPATVQPTATSEPTPASQPVTSTAIPPTATSMPAPTSQPAIPTAIPPTATAIAAPALGGTTQLTGSGSGNSDVFWSPKRLPWVVEWDIRGIGSRAMVLTLMDPDGNIELVELVSDSGTGRVGGLTWVHSNMGKYYVRVEGAEADWTIWIRPQ